MPLFRYLFTHMFIMFTPCGRVNANWNFVALLYAIIVIPRWNKAHATLRRACFYEEILSIALHDSSLQCLANSSVPRYRTDLIEASLTIRRCNITRQWFSARWFSTHECGLIYESDPSFDKNTTIPRSWSSIKSNRTLLSKLHSTKVERKNFERSLVFVDIKIDKNSWTLARIFTHRSLGW